MKNSSTPITQGKIIAEDRTELAYAASLVNKPQKCIIFYHGGGANHRAYIEFASALSKTDQISTFLFDIRGHGQSGGPRGYTQSKEMIWSDITRAIMFVSNQYPNTPIYLAGHSSGAGLILNYFSWGKKIAVHGYIMLAPELGYHVALQKIPFAHINRAAFILNKLSGGLLFNKFIAVRFNYAQKQIDDLGFLSGYTTNMAYAVTPDDPYHALLNMDVSLYIAIAEHDEIINNIALENLLKNISNPFITKEIMPNTTHLGIINVAHKYVSHYLSTLHPTN